MASNASMLGAWSVTALLLGMSYEFVIGGGWSPFGISAEEVITAKEGCKGDVVSVKVFGEGFFGEFPTDDAN